LGLSGAKYRAIIAFCEPRARFDQKMPLIEWVFFGFWSKTGEITPKTTQSSRFFGEILVWTEI
jgi:hypothetical protein